MFLKNVEVSDEEDDELMEGIFFRSGELVYAATDRGDWEGEVLISGSGLNTFTMKDVATTHKVKASVRINN